MGQRGNTLAFGLPGNPLAHFVCLNLYIRTALQAWAGQNTRSIFQLGTLVSDLVAVNDTRETFWPATWHLDVDGVGLKPLRWRSSGDLTALATANALMRVTRTTPGLTRGSRVEFVRTDK